MNGAVYYEIFLVLFCAVIAWIAFRDGHGRKSKTKLKANIKL